MESSFSVDSMIKEMKINLNKYESLLKSLEQYYSKKAYADIEKIKMTIENNIKLIQSVITKNEDKFMLNSLRELKEELDNNYSKIRKVQIQKDEKKKLNDLINNENCEIENKQNLELLNDENSSLKKSLALSTEINSNAINNNMELDNQYEKLSKTEQQVVKILKKIPIIDKMFGQIKFHKIKERLIIGFVIGIIIVLGLYLTLYR